MRSRYQGQEVSAAAVIPLVQAMHDSNIAPHLLPSLSEYGQTGLRISWDQFLQILNLARQHFSDEQLQAIGGTALGSSYYSTRMTLARSLLTLEDAYRLMIYPHNTIDYGCIQAAVDAKPGHVRMTAMLFEEYAPSEPFFVLLQGATQRLPKLFGVNDAKIRCDRDGRHMHFDIQFPTANTWNVRAKRRLSGRIRSLYCAWNKSNADDELIRRTFALESVIYQRDKALAELQQDRADQRRRMEHVSDVVVEYDHLNQVVYLSPNGENIFGHPNNVLLASPLKILHPEDFVHAEAFFANPKSLPSGSYPMRGRHANGQSLDLEVAVHHFDDEQGRPRWIATFRDITKHQLSAFTPVEAQANQRVIAPNYSQNTVSARAEAGTRLLLADDNTLTQRLASKVLCGAGYSVVCVNDGTSVLSEMQHQTVDALVLDINMPGLTGIEVYEQLQSEQVDMPIVFMSGDPEQLRQKYPRLPIVAKPFRSAQLIEAVREVLAA